MKVNIGSRYEGIPFDRPSLRQLPRGWVIEEARKIPVSWRIYCFAEKMILVVAALVLLYAAFDAVGRGM